MRTLYIIRHAKSSWSDPGLTDFERPLNERGKRDVKVMAKRLGKRISTIDLLLSSTAVRAKKTTKKIIDKSDIEFGEIKYIDQLYHAPEHQIIKIIESVAESVQSLAIVGHNPGLTNICNDIGNVQIDNLPTTGILAFEFAIEKWENILSEDGKLLFFDYPKRYKVKKFNA